jgi:hypothetical protein
MFLEIISVPSEIHTKHTNPLCGQNVEFVNVFSSYRAVNSSFMKSSQLILYCLFSDTKHINTLCGQNVPHSKHIPSRL